MGRNINQSEGIARFLGVVIRLLIIAAVIYGIYYFVNKNRVIENIKAKSEKTIEELTECKFSEINYINTDTEKNISVEEFTNKYKDKKYKSVSDMKKLSEDGHVTYYVYSPNNTYEYKLFDLGDGYIKIVKDSATLYKEVE